MRIKISFPGLLWLILFVIVFSSGCEQQQAADVMQGPVKLALKFSEADVSSYRVVTGMEKTLDFGGEISEDSQFVGGTTGDRAEVAFIQEIESVDAQGNATAKITITELKYVSKEKNVVHIDFDSTRAADQSSPLYQLTGATYQIYMSPQSKVMRIEGTEEITQQFTSNTLSKRIADALLSPNVIRQRHGVPVLATVGDEMVSEGDQWRYTKQVSFGQMGAEMYDVIYTYSDIERMGGDQVAVIDISSVPALETDAQSNALMDMFDNRSSLRGICKLNLTEGKVEQYTEKVEARWIMVDPEASGGEGEEPSTITMGYTQSHSIERID